MVNFLRNNSKFLFEKNDIFKAFKAAKINPVKYFHKILNLAITKITSSNELVIEESQLAKWRDSYKKSVSRKIFILDYSLSLGKMLKMSIFIMCIRI